MAPVQRFLKDNHHEYPEYDERNRFLNEVNSRA
jgi:hypothetical protein